MVQKQKNKKDASRSWLLTLKASDYSRQTVEERMSSYTYVGQLEEGKGGYLHWQVYIENKGPIRFSTLKNKFPTGHFEPRRGSRQQAFDYVTKEETRVESEPRVQNGEIRLSDEKGKRTDVALVRSAILDDGLSVDEVLLEYPEATWMTSMVEKLVAARDRKALGKKPRELEVLWLYGPAGSGKTSLAVDLGGEDFYRVTDYSHAFDGYAGEKTLVLDEFDGQFSLDLLLNVLDVWPLSLPARYANRQAAYTRVILVSNEAPSSFYSWAAWSRREALARRVHEVIRVASNSAYSEGPLSLAA